MREEEQKYRQKQLEFAEKKKAEKAEENRRKMEERLAAKGIDINAPKMENPAQNPEKILQKLENNAQNNPQNPPKNQNSQEKISQNNGNPNP